MLNDTNSKDPTASPIDSVTSFNIRERAGVPVLQHGDRPVFTLDAAYPRGSAAARDEIATQDSIFIAIVLFY